MYDYHTVLGVVAVTIGLLGFVPYFRDIFSRSTKPHVFTWIVWSLLTGLIFLIQLAHGAGPGAWVTGIESLSCFAVLVFAFSRGEKRITPTDWISFAAALIAMALWFFAHQPLLSVILVICADLLGYVPTVRKSYAKPSEETAALYASSSVHWLLSIAALRSLTLLNFLYPAVISMIDLVLVAELLIRRRQLSKYGSQTAVDTDV